MSELLEEYKICVQRVQTIDKNIWQSATIFGIGSLAGIITIFGIGEIINDHPESIIIISFLGITLNLVWWRLARRWWSLQQALISRMEFIERQLNFGGNLFIAYLDKINCRRKIRVDDDFSLLSEEVKRGLSEISNYECRGTQPVLLFLTIINVISWLSVALVFEHEFIFNIDKGVIVSIILGVLLFFWFFFEIWNRP